MKMKMNKTKSIICFIISIAVVLFLGYVVMFGVGGRHTGSAQNVTQGLDLMGGTSVSYQVDESKTKSFTATDLEDTRLKLENRVHTSVVKQQLTKKVTIESLLIFRVNMMQMQ